MFFPLLQFTEWLEKMNVTQKDERMYWHVQFIEDKNGSIRTSFKKGFPSVDVTKNLIA